MMGTRQERPWRPRYHGHVRTVARGAIARKHTLRAALTHACDRGTHTHPPTHTHTYARSSKGNRARGRLVVGPIAASRASRYAAARALGASALVLATRFLSVFKRPHNTDSRPRGAVRPRGGNVAGEGGSVSAPVASTPAEEDDEDDDEEEADDDEEDKGGAKEGDEDAAKVLNGGASTCPRQRHS